MSDSGATLVDSTDFNTFPKAPYNGWGVMQGVGWMLQRNPGAGDAFLEFKGDAQGPVHAQLLVKDYQGLLVGRTYRLQVRTKALVAPDAHPTQLEFRRTNERFRKRTPVTNPQWHFVDGTFVASDAEDTLQIVVSVGWDSDVGGEHGKDFYYPAFYSIKLYLEPA